MSDIVNNAITGHIDSVIDGVISGWMYSFNRPSLRHLLAVYYNGAVVASTVADRFRPDLLQAGVGDGIHGFAAELPSHLLPIDGAELVVTCVETATTLRPDQMTIISNSDPTKVRGCIDDVEDGVIWGWAYSPENPESCVEIEIIIDEAVVWRGVADQFRSDLFAEKIGNGCHAFSAALPNILLDGCVHNISARDAVTGMVLGVKYTQGLITQSQILERVFESHSLYALFDSNFYRQQVGDIENALQHYRDYGWREGRDPHPMFCTHYYVGLYGRDLETDPLTDFFTIGRVRNYETHPLFDCRSYLRRRRDVADTGEHPLFHYLANGHAEREICSDFFDESYYESQCPGLRDLGFIPLIHYLTFGWREGKRPARDFDPLTFAQLANTSKHAEPFTHFVGDLLRQKLQTKVVVSPISPKISIVILNLSKWLITLMCLYFLRRNTDLRDVEIIILDNGSASDKFAMLCKYGSSARIIRVNVNRGFGEGNNIAVEFARGAYLLFLNNDVYVTENWLPPLVNALEGDATIGAAGPKFLYPDGRLQEAGALITPCGTALQRGKYLDGSSTIYDGPNFANVDYISAAAMLMRTDEFRRILGYDLCWDPAYYEDADLCLKLRTIGLRTVYIAASKVIHVENGTSSDQQLNLLLHDIVAINRLKFVGRWSQYLSGASTGDEERRLTPDYISSPRPGGLPSLGLYTPYPLTPGGGERYLLTIASELRGNFDCTLLTHDQYSSLRLATIARELGINLQYLKVRSLDNVQLNETFDVFIAMGNEVLPPVSGMGKVNYFHCQFPFPLDLGHYSQNWRKLNTYDGFIVNSEFTSTHLAREEARVGLGQRNRFVVNPPVPQISYQDHADRAANDTAIILHVGRFAPGGHCKRQDTMIEAFKLLLKKLPPKIELHFAGSLGSDSASRIYLASLQKAALGTPIFFHVNVTQSQIHNLYRRAKIYWHLTGIGSDPDLDPHHFEHFGITICEAMSAGVVPIVLRHGGPSEIIRNGVDGFHISNTDELVARTAEVLKMETEMRDQLGRSAQLRASQFSEKKFGERILAILQQKL